MMRAIMFRMEQFARFISPNAFKQKLLSQYKGITFNLVAPPQLELPVEIEKSIVDKAHTVNKFPQLEEGIKNVEIIYVTRTQEERFPSQQDADKYRGLFRLNQSIYTEHCAP